MGRAPCCEKMGLKKGPWTPDEDEKLIAYIHEHGHGSWRALPKLAGLLRCGKSCRLRWTNYLRPDIKRGKFSSDEEQTIIRLHAILGNKWSAIAAHLVGRTDNEIKNHWNTHLKKRLFRMGIDPLTHQPCATDSSFPDKASNPTHALSHMAQWESARLEAEARLAHQSRATKVAMVSTTNTSSNSATFTDAPSSDLVISLPSLSVGSASSLSLSRKTEFSLPGSANSFISNSVSSLSSNNSVKNFTVISEEATPLKRKLSIKIEDTNDATLFSEPGAYESQQLEAILMRSDNATGSYSFLQAEQYESMVQSKLPESTKEDLDSAMQVRVRYETMPEMRSKKTLSFYTDGNNLSEQSSEASSNNNLSSFTGLFPQEMLQMDFTSSSDHMDTASNVPMDAAHGWEEHCSMGLPSTEGDYWSDVLEADGASACISICGGSSS